MSARSRKPRGGAVVTMSSSAMAQPPAFSARQALDAEDEEGRVDDSRRRQVGILRAEGIDEAVAEKELVGIGPARAVKDGLPRHVEIHAVLPVFSRLGRGRT